MADHGDDAQQIYEAAKASGAERIAFRKDGKYVLSKAKEAAILKVLEEESPQQYKLQARQDGRWVNRSSLTTLGTDASMLASINASGLDAANTLSTRELRRLASNDDAAFNAALRGVSRKLHDAQYKDPATPLTGKSLTFLDRLATVYESPPARYLHATVALLDAITPAMQDGAIDRADSDALARLVDKRISERPKLFDSAAGQVASDNLLGKVHSLTDRGLAADHFDAVRRADADGLIQHFYADMGARTYFSGPAAWDELTREIQGSIAALDVAEPSSRTGLVVSVDPKFYRVYAPTMYYYAQQMPDVDFNIVVCAGRAEAEQAVADGDGFRAALATLNRSGSPRNVHHYQVDVPAAVAERTTFYASVRFFAAQMMLERYQNIFLMDADFTADVDPRPFLKRVEKLPFGASHSRGFNALSPWRRIMAGSIPISRDALGTGILDALTSYLARGLTMDASWMLDQNALVYASERFPSSVADLRDYKRPFHQPPFRSVWEKNYRG